MDKSRFPNDIALCAIVLFVLFVFGATVPMLIYWAGHIMRELLCGYENHVDYGAIGRGGSIGALVGAIVGWAFAQYYLTKYRYGK